MNAAVSIEEKIAHSAFASLQRKSGLQLKPVEVNPVLGTGLWPDMRVSMQGTQIELIAEIKTNTNLATFDSTVKQLNTAAEGRPAMLIADHIDRQIGEKLRQQNINYLDAGGNAYINLPPFFVLVEGKPKSDLLAQTKPAKMFTPIDLQVIFALLANPGLLNANYREMAEHANVALGAFGTAFRELKDQGFLVESNRTQKREWRARHKLIGRWVEQYPSLKKKYFLGPYYTANQDWWRSSEFKRYDAHLGGNFAAEFYIHCERSDKTSIYLGDQQQWQFIREMRFVKASRVTEELAPSINVFSKFWGKAEQNDGDPQVTHPLITYADLIDSGDPESCAAANKIAERYFSAS